MDLQSVENYGSRGLGGGDPQHFCMWSLTFPLFLHFGGARLFML